MVAVGLSLSFQLQHRSVEWLTDGGESSQDLADPKDSNGTIAVGEQEVRLAAAPAASFLSASRTSAGNGVESDHSRDVAVSAARPNPIPQVVLPRGVLGVSQDVSSQFAAKLAPTDFVKSERAHLYASRVFTPSAA
jgi:hypothetical protein